MIIEKPWGEELIVEKNDKYVVKLLKVKANQRLSLQYHVKKHETMIIIEGCGTIQLGDETKAINVGDHIVIPPNTRHRLAACAECDLTILEASTPELDDVVRLEDDYDRSATDECKEEN